MRTGRGRASALAVAVAAVTAAGCGGPAENDRRLAGESIVETAEAVRKELIADADIEQLPEGSPHRALLKYWSDMQYGALDEAIVAYHPELRDAIGVAELADALRTAMPLYQQTRPEEVTVRRTEGGVALVRYIAPTLRSNPQPVPLSATMQRQGGEWRIVYNAALNDELRVAAQNAVQLEVKPGATAPDPRAVAAGERAAQIQGRYLRTRLPGREAEERSAGATRDDAAREDTAAEPGDG